MPSVSPLPASIDLPLGLLVETPWLPQTAAGAKVALHVPASYGEQLSALSGASEVLGIQRLLTMARRSVRFQVSWDRAIALRVTNSPTLFPLLAVLLLLDSAEHAIREGDLEEPLKTDGARKLLLAHHFARDLFADTDVVLCAEGAGPGLPGDLYDLETLKLLPREHFETLVLDALSPHLVTGADSQAVYKKAGLLGVIVAELVENSDMHGRLDLAGRPIVAGGIRGLVFKRLQLTLPVVRPNRGQPHSRVVDCFEVSVFDSGIGYYESYTRRALEPATELEEEWRVLHNCLERHYHGELPDLRPGHRGMGLYEVLRALQVLKGRLEIRTGRLFAYRTFLEGELQAQMEERAAYAHLSWPVPRLLDVEKRYFAKPTANEALIGSSVRVIIPLA
jgi:hypothetical protein